MGLFFFPIKGLHLNLEPVSQVLLKTYITTTNFEIELQST